MCGCKNKSRKLQSICISFGKCFKFQYICTIVTSSGLTVHCQRPIKGLVWWKGEFALFWMPMEDEWMNLPKCDHLPPLIVGKGFGRGGGLHSEKVICQSSDIGHWWVWSVSSWVQLIFSSRIGLHSEACSQNYSNYAMATQRLVIM